MSALEYKVVPAPTKGVKARGIKGPEHRFAYALETLMNDMAADGWEFQRAETLPSVERAGLTGSTTEWRNVLVFRRSVSEETEEFEHELLPAPDAVAELGDDPARASMTGQSEAVKPEPDAPIEQRHDADAFQLETASGQGSGADGGTGNLTGSEAAEPAVAADASMPESKDNPKTGSETAEDKLPDAVQQEFVQKIIEKSKD